MITPLTDMMATKRESQGEETGGEDQEVVGPKVLRTLKKGRFNNAYHILRLYTYLYLYF
jgi:hypothetical protein